MRRFLLLLAVVAGMTQPARAEERQMVKLPEMMREHMLSNMRDHLRALDEILLALAENRDKDAASIAEKRLGMSSLVAHNAEHMAPFMPDAMKQIGTSMHRAASRFARMAEVADLDPTPAGSRKVHAALQEITAACTGCHGAFRVH